MNVHNLVHIVQCVRSHGPLYMFSCFPFESFNKLILSAIHGPNNCELQVAKSVGVMQLIYTRFRDINDERTIEYLEKMKYSIRKSDKFDRKIIDEEHDTYAFGFAGMVEDRSYYKYIRYKGHLIEAIDLVRQRSFDNSIIQLDDGGFAQVHKFFVNKEGEWRMLIMLIKENRLREMA